MIAANGAAYEMFCLRRLPENEKFPGLGLEKKRRAGTLGVGGGCVSIVSSEVSREGSSVDTSSFTSAGCFGMVCRPDGPGWAGSVTDCRVLRSVGCGILVRGPGRLPGGGGDGGVNSFSSSPSSSEMIAGFRRAMATFSGALPGMLSLKELCPLEMIRYGPWYGVEKDDWMPPRRTNTCVVVWSSSGIWTRGFL